MQPTTPVLTEEFSPKEIVYAKDQREYMPLPAIRSEDGRVLTRWTFTEEEREAIASGADLLLTLLTFGQPLQPIQLEVPVCATDLVHVAHRMGLLVD